MSAIKKKRRRKPGWYILAFLITVVIVYFLFNTGRNVNEIWRLSRMKRQEERALKKAQETFDTLKAEKERLLTDSTYIEEIARREYGMKKKDEEIFVISDSDSVETE